MLRHVKGTGALLLLLLLFLSLLLWGCGSSTTVAPPPPAKAAKPAAAAPQPAAGECEPAEPADLDKEGDDSSDLGWMVKNSVDQLLGQTKRTLYTNTGYSTDPECLLALDCSYFVKQVLKALPAKYYDALPKSSSSHTTALAEDYYDYFSSLPTMSSGSDLWIRVEHIKDVQPGDIIAYKYTGKDKDSHDTTGHVMVAYTRAVQSQCKDTGQHWVYVADSADSGHADDVRNQEGRYAKLFQYTAYEGAGGKPSGVGIGKIWFNTGSDPYYRWKQCDGPKHSGAVIAIGRPMKPIKLK